MSTEVVTPIEDELEAPPAVTEPAKNGVGAKEDDDEKEGKGKVPLSKELKEVIRDEDIALRDLLVAIGPEGSFKVQLTRMEPEMVVVDGQRVKTGGILKSFTTAIDDEYIAKMYGGGKYALKIFKKNKGSWRYFAYRTLEIAGDPILTDLPRLSSPTAEKGQTVVQAPSEEPKLAGKMIDMLDKRLERAEERALAPPRERGPDPAQQALVQVLQTTISAQAAELAEMRKTMMTLQSTKPEPDVFRDQMIRSLMDQDNARVTTMRSVHESEIRQLKDSAIQDEKRLRDQFERDKEGVIRSFERELASVKQSHEVAMASLKMSHETSLKLLEGENKRLERDNNELRSDNKELRAKKEKSLFEQIQEVDKLKEVLGSDDDSDKGTVDKIVDVLSNPAAIEFAQGVIGRQPAQAQPQAQMVGQPAAGPPKPQITLGPDGKRYLLMPDGSVRGPLKKKTPKVQPEAPPGEPPLPEIDPQQMSQAVGLLERAFAGNQEPEVVAQSAVSMIPPDVMECLRRMGLEEFLVKVAKLPASSPLLANQAGKNWIRKFGKALVGE